MTTKNNGMAVYRGIYDSEYDAFTNYMNILGDFLKRVRDLYPDDVENDELNSLYTQITNMAKELNVKDNEISRLRARLEKYEPRVDNAGEPEGIPAGKAAPKAHADAQTAAKGTEGKVSPAKTAVAKAEPVSPKPGNEANGGDGVSAG